MDWHISGILVRGHEEHIHSGVAAMNTVCETTDLLVFSHLRWDFIFQRPQHLLSRHAKYRRVFYFEDPVFGMTEVPRLHLRETSENVLVVIPYLPSSIDASQIESAMTDLVDELVYEEEVIDYTLWYYTPEALSYTKHLEPRATIFDCMTELSSEKEEELLKKADIVFTSSPSLYESRKAIHHNIHSFPSSMDFSHFAQARQKLVEPDDQINIPHPRIGFYGVIDERLNMELIMQLADLKTDYHFVIIGPVSGIDPRALPKRNNIHYLGIKEYHVLPLYLASWDCAMIPYVVNESTEFLAPSKTPECLAAGRPVVSTPLRDVIHPYHNQNLVHIADNPEDFVDEIDLAIAERKNPEWLDRVDHYLRDNSWDITFQRMADMEIMITRPKARAEPRIIQPVTLNAGGLH
jgi:UDP-galactopyranose mutase